MKKPISEKQGLTREDIERIKKRFPGPDSLTESNIKSYKRDMLFDIGKGSEKRRRVKPGESKMKSFSMGGMADYIKDLL